MISCILNSGIRRFVFTAVMAAQFLPTAAGANSTTVERAAVRTHPSQGEVVGVDGANARLVRSSEGIFVDVVTSGLIPENVYTAWIVAINAPERCENAPCTSDDVMKLTDIVQSDLGFGDGKVAGPNGRARFTAFQPIGEMNRSWFGRGLQDLDAEVHVVLRDHGPLQPGIEADMLSTFRAGCSDASVPKTLPMTVRSDGPSGSYACANVQAAIFAP